MSATPNTISGHFLLEPSTPNVAALDNGTNGTITSSTTGTVANTTAAVNELLLVGVAIASGTVTVSGIADTRTLVWHKLSAITGSAVRGEIWWAWEPTAQTHTITVTLSSSGTAELICGSFSGVQSGVALGTAGASMPFDPTALTAAFGTATGAVSTSGVNTNPASMLIGFVGVLSNPSLTVGASYTTVSSAANSTTVSAGMEYQNVTASASQVFNYTLGSSHAYVIMGVALMSSGNYVQVVAAPSSQEFILKNIYMNGQVAVCKWDGAMPVYLGNFSSPETNLTVQVTAAGAASPDVVVLINLGSAIPIQVGYDGIRSI